MHEHYPRFAPPVPRSEQFLLSNIKIIRSLFSDRCDFLEDMREEYLEVINYDLLCFALVKKERENLFSMGVAKHW